MVLIYEGARLTLFAMAEINAGDAGKVKLCCPRVARTVET